jgi:hypothetical protein
MLSFLETMKRIHVYLIFLVSVTAAPSLAAEDAAIEAKEGKRKRAMSSTGSSTTRKSVD